jgi:hypothetical protein
LATSNVLAPRLGAIRFREKGILLCSSTSLGTPLTPSEFAKKFFTGGPKEKSSKSPSASPDSFGVRKKEGFERSVRTAQERHIKKQSSSQTGG